jgi:hypothetical protein
MKKSEIALDFRWTASVFKHLFKWNSEIWIVKLNQFF